MFCCCVCVVVELGSVVDIRHLSALMSSCTSSTVNSAITSLCTCFFKVELPKGKDVTCACWCSSTTSFSTSTSSTAGGESERVMVVYGLSSGDLLVGMAVVPLTTISSLSSTVTVSVVCKLVSKVGLGLTSFWLTLTGGLVEHAIVKIEGIALTFFSSSSTSSFSSLGRGGRGRERERESSNRSKEVRTGVEAAIAVTIDYVGNVCLWGLEKGVMLTQTNIFHSLLNTSADDAASSSAENIFCVKGDIYKSL